MNGKSRSKDKKFESIGMVLNRMCCLGQRLHIDTPDRNDHKAKLHSTRSDVGLNRKRNKVLKFSPRSQLNSLNYPALAAGSENSFVPSDQPPCSISSVSLDVEFWLGKTEPSTDRVCIQESSCLSDTSVDACNSETPEMRTSRSVRSLPAGKSQSGINGFSKNVETGSVPSLDTSQPRTIDLVSNFQQGTVPFLTSSQPESDKLPENFRRQTQLPSNRRPVFVTGNHPDADQLPELPIDGSTTTIRLSIGSSSWFVFMDVDFSRLSKHSTDTTRAVQLGHTNKELVHNTSQNNDCRNSTHGHQNVSNSDKYKYSCCKNNCLTIVSGTFEPRQCMNPLLYNSPGEGVSANYSLAVTSPSGDIFHHRIDNWSADRLVTSHSARATPVTALLSTSSVTSTQEAYCGQFIDYPRTKDQVISRSLCSTAVNGDKCDPAYTGVTWCGLGSDSVLNSGTTGNNSAEKKRFGKKSHISDNSQALEGRGKEVFVAQSASSTESFNRSNMSTETSTSKSSENSTKNRSSERSLVSIKVIDGSSTDRNTSKLLRPFSNEKSEYSKDRDSKSNYNPVSFISGVKFSTGGGFSSVSRGVSEASSVSASSPSEYSDLYHENSPRITLFDSLSLSDYPASEQHNDSIGNSDSKLVAAREPRSSNQTETARWSRKHSKECTRDQMDQSTRNSPATQPFSAQVKHQFAQVPFSQTSTAHRKHIDHFVPIERSAHLDSQSVPDKTHYVDVTDHCHNKLNSRQSERYINKKNFSEFSDNFQKMSDKYGYGSALGYSLPTNSVPLTNIPTIKHKHSADNWPINSGRNRIASNLPINSGDRAGFNERSADSSQGHQHGSKYSVTKPLSTSARANSIDLTTSVSRSRQNKDHTEIDDVGKLPSNQQPLNYKSDSIDKSDFSSEKQTPVSSQGECGIMDGSLIVDEDKVIEPIIEKATEYLCYKTIDSLNSDQYGSKDRDMDEIFVAPGDFVDRPELCHGFASRSVIGGSAASSIVEIKRDKADVFDPIIFCSAEQQENDDLVESVKDSPSLTDESTKADIVCVGENNNFPFIVYQKEYFPLDYRVEAKTRRNNIKADSSNVSSLNTSSTNKKSSSKSPSCSTDSHSSNEQSIRKPDQLQELSRYVKDLDEILSGEKFAKPSQEQHQPLKNSENSEENNSSQYLDSSQLVRNTMRSECSDMPSVRPKTIVHGRDHLTATVYGKEDPPIYSSNLEQRALSENDISAAKTSEPSLSRCFSSEDVNSEDLAGMIDLDGAISDDEASRKLSAKTRASSNVSNSRQNKNLLFKNQSKKSVSWSDIGAIARSPSEKQCENNACFCCPNRQNIFRNVRERLSPRAKYFSSEQNDDYEVENSNTLPRTGLSNPYKYSHDQFHMKHSNYNDSVMRGVESCLRCRNMYSREPSSPDPHRLHSESPVTITTSSRHFSSSFRPSTGWDKNNTENHTYHCPSTYTPPSWSNRRVVSSARNSPNHLDYLERSLRQQLSLMRCITNHQRVQLYFSCTPRFSQCKKQSMSCPNVTSIPSNLPAFNSSHYRDHQTYFERPSQLRKRLVDLRRQIVSLTRLAENSISTSISNRS